MKKHEIFSTNIITFENKELAPKLKEYILSLSADGIESDVAKILKNNLTESKFDFFTHENEVIEETKYFISSCLKKAINNLSGLNDNYEIRFKESWYHIGKKNSSHDAHIHGNCSWFGIFYVQAGDLNSGGQTIFNSPLSTNFLDYATLHMKEPAFIVNPEAGKLVLFPSYLQHYQSLYSGSKDRIVVAFNSIIFKDKNNL